MGRDVRSAAGRQPGRCPPAGSVTIVTQVASALDAAHSFGLVHRDVKPGNMLLDAVGGQRPARPHLPVRLRAQQAVAVASGLTGTGQFLGTLDYVAPEQIEGKTVDGRADLYALAGAAYEMLGGAPPFRRDEGLAILWAQISATPPPVTSLRPELPEAVNGVLLKALAKAPADRYDSCLEFAAALRAACGIRPDPASDPGTQPGQVRERTELAMPITPPVSPAPGTPQPAGPARPPPPARPASCRPRSAGTARRQARPRQARWPARRPPAPGPSPARPAPSRQAPDTPRARPG